MQPTSIRARGRGRLAEHSEGGYSRVCHRTADHAAIGVALTGNNPEVSTVLVIRRCSPPPGMRSTIAYKPLASAVLYLRLGTGWVSKLAVFRVYFVVSVL